MLRDFEEGLDEAWQCDRASARWFFRGRLFSDFARTLGLQWLRTGWPIVAVLAMAITLASTAALATVWRRMVILLPSGTADQDVIALEMLTVVVFLFIIATVLLTMWSGRIVRRGTRRRTPSATIRQLVLPCLSGYQGPLTNILRSARADLESIAAIGCNAVGLDWPHATESPTAVRLQISS
jgi:hypothetical protein